MGKLKRLIIKRTPDGYDVISHLHAARGRYRIGKKVHVSRKGLKAFLNAPDLGPALGLDETGSN